MINTACFKAINEKGHVAPGYKLIRHPLLRRVMQPVTAMQRDDCGKRAFAFGLRKITVHSIARNVLGNFPALPSEALLQAT